jgi:AraC-like DNA-binding protein
MDQLNKRINIMAVDCCEHVLRVLKNVLTSDLTVVPGREVSDVRLTQAINLIAIGIATYPVRRLFVSQLRRIYSDVPVLVLRRELANSDFAAASIRAEFLLSDKGNTETEFELIAAVRRVMPFEACEHLMQGQYYDTVRSLVQFLTEQFGDPELDLTKVARELEISPKQLSLILNREVGVSFPNLLRNLRIEEAKRMLQTRKYSVKEVAARVGFTDSHYFSRTFKEVTGQPAGEFRETASII